MGPRKQLAALGAGVPVTGCMAWVTGEPVPVIGCMAPMTGEPGVPLPRPLSILGTPSLVASAGPGVPEGVE